MIVQQPTAEFEINISDRSFVTNATYQTDAQSKFSVKIQQKKILNWPGDEAAFMQVNVDSSRFLFPGRRQTWDPPARKKSVASLFSYSFFYIFDRVMAKNFK